MARVTAGGVGYRSQVDQENFQGGVNAVVRTGNKVRRPSGPWTPAVHALLHHLRANGFDAAPQAHGLDEQGREVLDFAPGEVPGYPMPAYVWTDETLTEVARLLRAFHDATSGFTEPASTTWYLPPREPREVICHGDIAPYNSVFRDGRPVAFIDFDTAHPGPRVWDVAYAAYRFVPLAGPDNFDARHRAGRAKVEVQSVLGGLRLGDHPGRIGHRGCRCSGQQGRTKNRSAVLSVHALPIRRPTHHSALRVHA